MNELTTPAGHTVYARKDSHKRGPIMAYSLTPGGHPVLVTYRHHKVYREHYGFSHGVTAWHDGQIALGGREHAPLGEDHSGQAATRKAALAWMDRIIDGLPAVRCTSHPSQPAVRPGRCQGCVDSARATAERLLSEIA